MRKLALLFMIAGIVLLSIGGYQLYKINAAEKAAAEEARAFLNEATESDDVSQEPIDFLPEIGQAIGFLHIPALDAELPIVEGTDPEELEQGVGHYRGSAFPKQGDQIVLSGHRDTVFRGMGDLVNGDRFIVELPYGEFEYEMVDSKIVEADDTTIIKSTSEEELVVTTCYPFHFVGNAPQRYIIYAKPVE